MNFTAATQILSLCFGLWPNLKAINRSAVIDSEMVLSSLYQAGNDINIREDGGGGGMMSPSMAASYHPYDGSFEEFRFKAPPDGDYPWNTDDLIVVTNEIVWAVGQHMKVWRNISASGYAFPGDYMRDVRTFCKISAEDAAAVLLYAIAWIVLRLVMTAVIFKPICYLLSISGVESRKFNQSLWSLLAYSALITFTLRVLFFSGFDFYFDVAHIFVDFKPHEPMPEIGRQLLIVQLSFYFHALFSTIFLELKKKDFIAFIVHHVITCACIAFALALKYWKISAICLLIDITDIFLEVGKVCVSLRKCSKSKTMRSFWDAIATTASLLFALSWIVVRLWIYWTRLLRGSLFGTVVSGPIPLPFAMTENLFLIVIYVLNWYWFTFIIEFVAKCVLGGASVTDDTREIDADFDGDGKVKSE